VSAYRNPDPAVRREMWRRRLAHFRRHPLRRYGWDSVRRVRPRKDAAEARAVRQAHLVAIGVLAFVALVIIVWGDLPLAIRPGS
jgi:hypothetical protein